MMFCVNCGAERYAGHRFCGHCGANLSEATAQPVPPTGSQFDHVANELESGLGEELYRSVLAHRPSPAREPQTRSQEPVVKPKHRAWFRAAQLGVFMFAVAHDQSDDPLAILFGSAVLGMGTWLVTLALASAIINGRPAQPASAFYVKRFHDDAKQVRAIWLACLATGLLIAGGSIARACALHDLSQIAGVAEGAIWLALACVPRVTLRHAGKVALLALTCCVAAKGFAQVSGFSPAAVVYAWLFVTLYRARSEGRFARRYLGKPALGGRGSAGSRSAMRPSSRQPLVATATI